jgi:hypothetical protein
MRPALDPVGHRVPRTKPTYLLHTWRPHRRRPFALVLHLHQHQSSRNLQLQYLAKNQTTQCCQSLITQGSDHPPVLEPHMVLTRGARGLSARHPRTVRPAHADRPKPHPTNTRKHNGSKAKTSKNTKITRRTLCARTVRQALAKRSPQKGQAITIRKLI